jgi:ATP-dependent 26S proteasome regulatory subunit
MVGLPDADNREKILRAILSKEELAEDFDFKELSTMTEGYSGSDLKVGVLALFLKRFWL